MIVGVDLGLGTWLSMLLAGASAPTQPPSAAASPPAIVQLDGLAFEVVPAGVAVAVGEVVTYRVLVEPRYRALAEEFAAHVDETLADTRGWAAAGYSFVPVDGAADLTVVLAGPRATDRLCAPLRTGGAFSCGRDGRAVINARRFVDGAGTYRGQLAAYRTHVINHEVGHLLGFDHRPCPYRGATAPVMLQQTKSLSGCRRRERPAAAEIAALAARPPRYLAAREPVRDGAALSAGVADAATVRAREGRVPLRSAP